MKLNINIKELFKGILIICSYLLLTNILAIPFIFLYQANIINESLLYILVYLLLTIIFIYIYRKDLVKDFKDFKKNYKPILKKTLKYWFIGTIIMIISSNIISYINIPNNTNQSANIELFTNMPITECLLAILFAPIIEELVFRRSLKDYTNNKHLYAFSSGLLFALIHITSSISSLSDIIMLVYLIPYASVGIALGYSYKETNNIIGNITIHSFHNLLSLLEIVILIILGGTI